MMILTKDRLGKMYALLVILNAQNVSFMYTVPFQPIWQAMLCVTLASERCRAEHMAYTSPFFKCL